MLHDAVDAVYLHSASGGPDTPAQLVDGRKEDLPG